MPEDLGKHLDLEDRVVIEQGISDGRSASSIARLLEVSTSTIIREVKNNRWARTSKSKTVRPARKCGNYDSCRHQRDACTICIQSKPKRNSCRLCDAAMCTIECSDFVPRTCVLLDKWPYICRCDPSQRRRCDLPKHRYSADRAQKASDKRRSESRRGISLDQTELETLCDLVMPLLQNGLSPRAIWLSHEDEIPISERTFYAWIESGILDIPSIALPRKVRYRARKTSKKKSSHTPALDGHEFKDFLELPLEVQRSAVQIDSVIGLSSNDARILSIHFPRIVFQFYLLLDSFGAEPVVSVLDRIEGVLGGPCEFKRSLGVLLADRGSEFADIEGMERSVFDRDVKRCQVYLCDPMRPNQKGSCERNHAELRRILPKGRSDFDKLAPGDLALIASHINSYPRSSLNGACPIDLAQVMLPSKLLDAFSIGKIPIEEVILRPSLLPHAVEL